MKIKNKKHIKKKIKIKGVKRRGFTLLELMVYISIYTILVAQIINLVFQLEMNWGKLENRILDYAKKLPTLKSPINRGFIALSYVIFIGLITLTLSFVHVGAIKNAIEQIYLYMDRKDVYVHEQACKDWVRFVYGQNSYFSAQACNYMAKQKVILGDGGKIDKIYQYFR